MSLEERTGIRSLIYSRWHRPSTVRQLLGTVAAAKLTMVDIDSCEACCYCQDPIALIETEKTSRPTPKNARITAALARLAGIEAYSVAYAVDDSDEITHFNVRRIWPTDEWIRFMNPPDYARFLLSLRDRHNCAAIQREAA